MMAQRKAGPDQRRQMIAEAAYFRAERRGFGDDRAVDDWLAAEAEVDARLREIEEERLLDRLDEQLAAANEKLQALREKAAAMTAEARAEWAEDLEKLAKLRDSFQTRVAEIREQGAHAGQTAKRQAEKIRDEISDAVHRFGLREKTRAKPAGPVARKPAKTAARPRTPQRSA